MAVPRREYLVLL